MGRLGWIETLTRNILGRLLLYLLLAMTCFSDSGLMIAEQQNSFIVETKGAKIDLSPMFGTVDTCERWF